MYYWHWVFENGWHVGFVASLNTEHALSRVRSAGRTGDLSAIPALDRRGGKAVAADLAPIRLPVRVVGGGGGYDDRYAIS